MSLSAVFVISALPEHKAKWLFFLSALIISSYSIGLLSSAINRNSSHWARIQLFAEGLRVLRNMIPVSGKLLYHMVWKSGNVVSWNEAISFEPKPWRLVLSFMVIRLNFVMSKISIGNKMSTKHSNFKEIRKLAKGEPDVRLVWMNLTFSSVY